MSTLVRVPVTDGQYLRGSCRLAASNVTEDGEVRTKAVYVADVLIDGGCLKRIARTVREELPL
jgi:hypothetical protein